MLHSPPAPDPPNRLASRSRLRTQPGSLIDVTSAAHAQLALGGCGPMRGPSGRRTPRRCGRNRMRRASRHRTRAAPPP
eukprot:6742787-Prymnesium_polylepis.1